jgi:hypothetical protein
MKKKTNLLHEGLAKAILDLHGCKSTWIESVPVREEFESETVWDGVVEVFDLENHPTANRAYAWSHRIGHSRKRCFFAVLHQGPGMLFGQLSLMSFAKKHRIGRIGGKDESKDFYRFLEFTIILE